MSVYKPPPPPGSTYLYVDKVGIPINQYTTISITTDYYGNVIIRGCGVYYEYTKTNSNKETKKVSIKPTEEGLITVTAGTRTHYIYPSGNEIPEPDQPEDKPPYEETPPSPKPPTPPSDDVPDVIIPEPIDDTPPEDKPPSDPTPPEPEPPYIPPIIESNNNMSIFLIILLIIVAIAIFIWRR